MKHRWLLFLVLIGVSFVSVTGWSVYHASSGGSRVTDHDYYHQGQHYTQSQLQQNEAENLGWIARCTVQADVLEIRLVNADGSPVTGASTQLEIPKTGDNGKTMVLTLQERENGLYVTRLPEAVNGEISAKLSCKQGTAHLKKKLLIFTGRNKTSS